MAKFHVKLGSTRGKKQSNKFPGYFKCNNVLCELVANFVVMPLQRHNWWLLVGVVNECVDIGPENVSHIAL